ncbi:hypothetical protein CR513_01439, partial [Mucuna pruriens]
MPQPPRPNFNFWAVFSRFLFTLLLKLTIATVNIQTFQAAKVAYARWKTPQLVTVTDNEFTKQGKVSKQARILGLQYFIMFTPSGQSYSKSRIKHQRVRITISMGNLDISRMIAQGIRLGSKRKIDSGCTTHVSNTMQGFLTIQTLSPNKKFVFKGNRVKALVEAIGTYRLILDIRHHIDLLETLYVPSLSRILVSLSKLDVIGYSFNFGNGCFNLFKHNHLISGSILYDGLYKLNLDGMYVETLLSLHHNVGTKHSLVNKHPTFLWHKCLGHISRERMKNLVKNEILPYLGKQTKHTKKGATRSTQLLEIVHTDTCGSFDVNSFGKKRYVITFIDDYSHYGYIYLLHEKSQVVDDLKIYLNEVERQLDRKMKVVRSDKGGEYYRRCDEIGQHSGPFAKLLQKRDICAQYTMSSTLQQNGVLVRRNRTLMDMVRNMFSNSSLPLSLWMVPSKAVPKTHFEL